MVVLPTPPLPEVMVRISRSVSAFTSVKLLINVPVLITENNTVRVVPAVPVPKGPSKGIASSV